MKRRELLAATASLGSFGAPDTFEEDSPGCERVVVHRERYSFDPFRRAVRTIERLVGGL